jgi:5-deoxy-glucuronate isomerase
MTSSLYLPAGTAADGKDPVAITPELAGWEFTGLRIIELEAGDERVMSTETHEMAVLPLEGSCTVECDGKRFELFGREHVFASVSDFAYVPRDAEVRITSSGGGRFALPSAEARRRLEPAYGSAEQVPVEIRGAAQASRQINNFLEADAFPADRLCAVEVLTPEGNWSSYPPHKHDEISECEAKLEEIYYFEIAKVSSRDGSTTREVGTGFGLHRLYTKDRQIDLTESVAHGDVVLIPRGYHGPSVAALGYDMYYLNVLAGPMEGRTMAFCDDPAHHWVRDSWADQKKDPRLPIATALVRRGHAKPQGNECGGGAR